jgi:hypothetical protein
VTSVYIVYDRMADRIMSDALRARGVTLRPTNSVGSRPAGEFYCGDIADTPDQVDAWFEDLPWTGDDTASLVTYGRGIQVTSVVVDGELVSTTRVGLDGEIRVDNWTVDAA